MFNSLNDLLYQMNYLLTKVKFMMKKLLITHLKI